MGSGATAKNVKPPAAPPGIVADREAFAQNYVTRSEAAV
jgi:hypothetical protein